MCVVSSSSSDEYLERLSSCSPRPMASAAFSATGMLHQTSGETSSMRYFMNTIRNNFHINFRYCVKNKVTTAKRHYIERQGTATNGSIYPRFEISHTLI